MRCEWLREIERRERLACRKKRRAKRGLQMVASLPSPYCFSQRLLLSWSRKVLVRI